jgi:hypothetical protein
MLLPKLLRNPKTNPELLADDAHASAAKVTSNIRLAPARRLATLVAFRLEATAQHEALEVLDMLRHDLFGHCLS